MRIAGNKLSATWSCERTPTGYEITLESRSGRRGTSSERNADYKQALALILAQLGAHEYILVDVQLTSAKALALAPSSDARRVHIKGVSYPIALNTIDSHVELGRAIQRAIAGMFSERTDPGGGNREKRTTLSVTPSAQTSGSDNLRAWLEFGTADAREPDDRPFTGSDYRQVDESISMSHSGSVTIDPAAVERALSGHRRTQNALARFLAERGLKPLSPVGDPDFDLAWEEGGAFYVAEVKSITNLNEEGQLRLGLGQVLRYRHALSAQHRCDVRAVIVAEREPRDARWKTLCAELNVVLTWAPFAALSREIAEMS